MTILSEHFIAQRLRFRSASNTIWMGCFRSMWTLSPVSVQKVRLQIVYLLAFEHATFWMVLQRSKTMCLKTKGPQMPQKKCSVISDKLFD